MYWHSKPKTNKIPTSIYMGRGKFVLVCHDRFLPAHCYPVLPRALNVHGAVLAGADVRSTWVIYPRWLGVNLLVTFLRKLQRISWLCWEASKCKRDNTGGWSTWGKKMKPFEGVLEPLQQSKENLLLFKSHTQRGRGPTFTEPQLWVWNGTRMQKSCRHFRLTQQSSVSQDEERTSPRILIGLSFPGVDRETRNNKEKTAVCLFQEPIFFSVQKIPRDASNSIIYFPLCLLSLTCLMPETTVRWVSFGHCGK